MTTSVLQYASHGGPDHLLALYAEHLDSARALACRLLYDPTEAEDVVHDVFLSLFRRPERFDPTRGTARSWLLTVVRNRSLDHLRRRCHVAKKDINDMADRLEDPQCADVLE